MKINVRGFIFLIDQEDYDQLREFKLYVNVSRSKPYLYLKNSETKNNNSVAKFILNTDQKITYIDGNTTNLSKSNLRTSTPELKILQDKLYYEKNKEKIITKTLEWQKQNPEKTSAKQKRYNKSLKGAESRRLNSRNLNPRYRNLRYSAKKRNKSGRTLEMTLTFEEYENLIKQNCYYCSKSLKNETGSSLDRIDNKKGYIQGNVLPCCSFCNTVRMDNLTVDENKHVITELIKYRKIKAMDDMIRSELEKENKETVLA